MLTLVAAPDTGDIVEDSIEAATGASHQHPCRIIPVVSEDRGAPETRLDRQLRVGGDQLGGQSNRRITDATNTANPLGSIKSRLQGYTPGDIDLAWSRVTYWRALLASSLDQPPYEPVVSALVSGLKHEPALDIMAGWLANRIDGSLQRAAVR